MQEVHCSDLRRVTAIALHKPHRVSICVVRRTLRHHEHPESLASEFWSIVWLEVRGVHFPFISKPYA